jgi:hypothetical protein
MSTLETIKNALLISLLLMLIYVLYKRMLRVLGKDNIQSKYPAIGNELEWLGDVAKITVELKKETYLIIEVFTKEGALVHSVAEGEYAVGKHVFEFNKQSFAPGKYFYKVTSSYQESSQYFEISS